MPPLPNARGAVGVRRGMHAIVYIASALAIVVAFAGLLWAAVQDGRDEAMFRSRLTHR